MLEDLIIYTMKYYTYINKNACIIIKTQIQSKKRLKYIFAFY